jgi:chromate reductase
MNKKVAVIVGSLRKEAYSRKLANAAIEIAKPMLDLEIIEIGDMPHYNQDFDDLKNPPATWTEFRDKIKTCDAILFITPEYNRSFSGVIKNAIDVGSRPYGSSVWNKKPAAIISSSPGGIGGFGANQHLRQSLTCLTVPVLPYEAYIGNVTQLFDEKGALINDGTKEFLQKLMTAFSSFTEKNLA